MNNLAGKSSNYLMNPFARSHKELRVYQNAMNAALEIFDLTERFPHQEKYSLTDQIRRSSRSVCANIAEAWRKRRYHAAFVAKLSDAEGEACETQVWIEFASRFRYLEHQKSLLLDHAYDEILSQLVKMIDGSQKWVIK